MVWCAILGLDRWVEVTQLPVTLSETSVEVRDRDGKLLRAYPIETGIMRLAVRPEWVDPGFVAMLIRYEDKRFHDHPGVDLLALVRAVGQAVWNRRAVSGGSTLTMQVARLLENGSTGRWNGKLRQMRVALALERRLSKAQILTLYLTHAPYGGNLEGIRAATLAWFGKEPGRLTAAQAGLLVALPQSPERRRPDRFPRVAADARNRVLARMETYGVLDQAEHAAAVREAMPAKMRRFPMFAPHLADRLRQHNPEAQRVDLTIDVAVQAQVEQVARSAAHHAGRRVSTAILVADHQTGEILASVGSPDYVDRRRQGFVDMTQAVRSPGSTLKPLIYGLAFDQGLVHPETLIHDGPVDFEGYAPRNFDGVFRGDLRVREALQLSLNIPVVKLTHELGAPRIMASLRRAGADPHLPGGAPGLAIALGGVGVSLQDLVQLYAGISRGGQGPGLWVDQLARPVTRGRLMSPEAAWHLGDILRDLSPPPGGRAGVLAYKTGTSYGHRDTWAIGWDGRHVIGVWMGRADGTPVPGAFGAELAAPVLFEAFSRLKPDLEPFAPPPPATLILGSAELPQPLRRFRSRNAAFSDADDEGPKLVFPPDGAILAVGETGLVLKVQGGQTPFLVMADGVPVMTNQRSHAFEVPTSGQGFSTLVVVDRAGRTDRVRVQIR
ncbi:penicillin-binding protein 1C [Rhodobacteraceae bacterium M382]|nr:penicillin-binding protein 1C [Rhodobacteraceae bacterium M382]